MHKISAEISSAHWRLFIFCTALLSCVAHLFLSFINLKQEFVQFVKEDLNFHKFKMTNLDFHNQHTFQLNYIVGSGYEISYE